MLPNDLHTLGIARVPIGMVVPNLHDIQPQLDAHRLGPELPIGIAKPSLVVFKAQAQAVIALWQLREQARQGQSEVLVGEANPAQGVGADWDHGEWREMAAPMLGPHSPESL